MSSLMTRGGLFDDFFKDIAPGFYVRPLHGDPLPSPAQIKVDVKETDKGYTVEAEVPGVSKALTRKCCAASAISVLCRAASSCRWTSTRRRPRRSTTTAC